MVKRQHKIMCLVLCLMMAVSTVFVGAVNAFAATGDTVYVRVNNGWSNVNCYMWSDSLGNNASWPGKKMTKVEDGVYSYTLEKDFDMVIFNNGSQQTGNLKYPGHGKIYDLTAGTWSDYEGAPTQVTTVQPATSATAATSATSATEATTPTQGGDGTTVYLNNEAGWSNATIYMWNSGNDTNASWPGVSMTNIGGNIYQYTASKTYANCIFSNSGASKTGDLTAMDGYVYNNKTNEWSVYDTSPLQVKSFTADPASGIYTDTDVTLSADAANKNGAAVSYKFSVTNEQGGTSTLSDFSSAKTVTWTPSVAGTYTINFDFKDTDGNTNNRTLTLTVNDDSTLVKPVIKSVVPANLNLIKVNSQATVSVKAGGGKTGTNLLFYKYVVTDPNGSQNTPYYTLNSTYAFTPTMKGVYKVNVYVQGSDNSTVSKTYTYTATDDASEPTTIVVPTTAPQPTTAQPTTAQPTTAQPTTIAQPTTVQPTTVQPTTAVQPTTSGKILGDANGDGKVTIVDVTMVQRVVVGLDPVSSLDMEVCDINRDNQINIKDATLILCIVVGLS